MKKRFLRVLALALTLVFLCNFSALAVETRASAYIAVKSGGITPTGNGSMRVFFDLTATGMMDKLGASAIHIYTDDEELAAEIQHTDPGCSNMMTTNNYSYGSSVNWQGVSGERYYAVITFYAKNSSGDDYRSLVTTTVTV